MPGGVPMPAYRNMALRCAGTKHENGLRSWVEVTVTATKPVSFSVKGLRQVIKTNDVTPAYRRQGMTIRASLPLPFDETYFLTNH